MIQSDVQDIETEDGAIPPEKHTNPGIEENHENIEVPLDISQLDEAEVVASEDATELDMDADQLLMEYDEKDPPIQIRSRDDVYYEMYLAAKTKAQAARDLAIQSFLEAKRIQNLYQIVDTDTDLAPTT